ncbi:MBL fold metallo-hydrolase, partial [Candidatus Pelagibacter sp.]|nr:MBL fold metallo-hydrolase [Candidatus Pelagibacter sp.]
MIFKQLFDKTSFTYTYLIASKKGREALIIDPVLDNVEQYIVLLKELDLKLVKVIDTHIHADHVTGASKLKDQTDCSTIMGDQTPADAVEIKVKDEEIIKLDQLELKALHTPGHTSDSFSFIMNNYLFSGDTLLINGTGRTDFQN